ncbi:MAG: hypothetical protein ACXAC2_10405, partial [Candidatus Kariarchaeaceae archaeon]
FRSDILTIGDTIGPVTLTSLTQGTSFDQSGFTLNFSVINNGSKDLDLRLDFTTSSPSKIFFIIDGVNSTTHSFTLDGFSTTLIPDTLIQINTTSEAILDETYLILVNLFDNDSMKWFATEALLLTYEL